MRRMPWVLPAFVVLSMVVVVSVVVMVPVVVVVMRILWWVHVSVRSGWTMHLLANPVVE